MTGLLGQSRLFVVLGRERLLPARLANVSSRTGALMLAGAQGGGSSLFCLSERGQPSAAS